MEKLSKNIVTLTPGLREVGRIRIGKKGKLVESSGGTPFRIPVKLDHFEVTTLEKDETTNFVKDTELHEILGEKPKTIPIMLLFDEIGENFRSRMAVYKGDTCICYGDGKTAYEGIGEKKKERKCSCEKSDKDYKGSDKCKWNGTLSVIITSAKRLGSCWKYRTTGYNSVQSLYSSLFFIKRMTKGYLAGINLNLVVTPKQTKIPATGKPVKIWVVGVEYAGDMVELKKEGIEIQKLDSECEKQRLLTEANTDLLSLELDPDEVAEFYPPDDDADEIPTIKDGVDTGTGEVFEEEKKPKPTKAELTEQYFNDNFADLCTKKPFGGLKFSDLKKKDKDWVYAQMTSPPADKQEPEEVEQEEVIEPEEISGTSSPTEETPVIEEKKTKTKSKTKEPEKGFIEIPGTGKDNGWG